MTDREDFHGGYPPPKPRPEWNSSAPKFTVRSETLGPDVIANFRVKPEVHKKIKDLSEKHGVGMQDVVRQMIDFALEHT